MYMTLLIYETYNNSEINPDFENNRSALNETKIYKSLSEENKILFDEYIELDKIIGAFYYQNSKVHKFVDDEKQHQILQIIWEKDKFNEYLADPEMQSEYYDFLRVVVWNDMFEVEQEVYHIESETEPTAFENYQEAFAIGVLPNQGN